MEHTYLISPEPFFRQCDWLPKTYRRHTIRFTRPRDAVFAVVYADEYKVYEACGDTISDAAGRAKRWIDQQLLADNAGTPVCQ